LNGFPPPNTNSTNTAPAPASVRSVETASPSRQAAVDTNLFMRTFRINTNIFYTAVQKALGTNVPVTPKAIAGCLRDLFGRFGVDLAKPKALFPNDRLGLIFVKATGDDLQVIERVFESLDEPTAEQRRLRRMNPQLSQTNLQAEAGIPAQARAGGSPELDAREPAITYQPDAAGNPGAAVLQASGLVRDGKVLYEMGKLAEAETKLNQALALDPNNAAAKYYLYLIQTPAGQSGGNPGRQAILHKLASIRLAKVSYQRQPLREVLRDLAENSRLLDPAFPFPLIPIRRRTFRRTRCASN